MGHEAKVLALKRKLGRAVRQRRGELGLSQVLLAERAGLHPSYIIDTEAGVWNVTLNTLARLCAALDMRLSELGAAIGREPEESKIDQLKNTAGGSGSSSSRACLTRQQLCHNLGEVIRKRRAELGYSKVVLAERAGVCRDFLTRIEAGEKNASLHIMSQFCAALDLPLSDLLAAIEGNSGKAPASDKAELGKTTRAGGPSGAQVHMSRARLYQHLGELFRKRRIELECPQRLLGVRVGLKDNHISQMEAGRRNVKLHTLARLCVALDLRLSDLYGASDGDWDGVEEMPEKSATRRRRANLITPASLKRNRERFGRFIRKRRLELGFSQAHVAERSHFRRNYIGAMENGAVNVTLYSLALLSAALDLSLPELCAAIEGGSGNTKMPGQDLSAELLHAVMAPHTPKARTP